MSDVGKISAGLTERARVASRVLAVATGEKKVAALLAIADRLEAEADVIIEANRKDLDRLPADTAAAFRDRLTLDADRIGKMAAGVRTIFVQITNTFPKTSLKI